MSKTFPFRRDDGTIYEASFEEMMSARDGFLTLESGEVLRRVHEPTQRYSGRAIELEKPIVSDALGVIGANVEAYREDARRNGFTGIEFVPDPTVDKGVFYQVRAVGRREFQRYLKHRGMFDKNSRNGSGATLTEADLERARQHELSRPLYFPEKNSEENNFGSD